jgi:cob(I)alamin adenosyltransferase
MSEKRSSSIDELCYPFIYEHSSLCDYEIITDELCSLIGAALGGLPKGLFDDVAGDLERLQPLAYHLNGSVRGRLAIGEGDLQWLQDRYHHYRSQATTGIKSAVLPRGSAPVLYLHLARSAAKKAIRLLLQVEQQGKNIPAILYRFSNLLCNFFFVLALETNRRLGVDEIPFESRSYGQPKEE